MIDSRDLKELHPTLYRGACELITRMKELGYPVGVSSTYRDNEAQNALYAKGRTMSGAIVTNAKGGQSIHNYRLAFDVFKNVKSQEYSDALFFETAGRIWQRMGGEWGGSWTGFVDRPHMQYTGNLKLSNLQKGELLPLHTLMPWEINNQQKVEEVKEMRYNNLKEIPDWGKPAIEKMIEGGAFADINNLDLSIDMIRTYVLLFRLNRI